MLSVLKKYQAIVKFSLVVGEFAKFNKNILANINKW